MKIRYIKSMAGKDFTYTPNEKDKGGKYVWYEVDDYQAVRLIDAEIAVYQTKDDYTKAKANYATLEAQKLEEAKNREVLENIEAYENEFNVKKEQYKALGAEIKDLDTKIKAAKASVAK